MNFFSSLSHSLSPYVCMCVCLVLSLSFSHTCTCTHRQQMEAGCNWRSRVNNGDIVLGYGKMSNGIKNALKRYRLELINSKCVNTTRDDTPCLSSFSICFFDSIFFTLCVWVYGWPERTSAQNRVPPKKKKVPTTNTQTHNPFNCTNCPRVEVLCEPHVYTSTLQQLHLLHKKEPPRSQHSSVKQDEWKREKRGAKIND